MVGYQRERGWGTNATIPKTMREYKPVAIMLRTVTASWPHRRPGLTYPPHSPGGSRPERDKIDARLQKSARNGTFGNLERPLSHSGRSTPDLTDTTTPRHPDLTI